MTPAYISSIVSAKLAEITFRLSFIVGVIMPFSTENGSWIRRKSRIFSCAAALRAYDLNIWEKTRFTSSVARISSSEEASRFCSFA